MTKLEPGDRVRLREPIKKLRLRPTPDRFGTVLRNKTDGKVRLVWDGVKSSSVYFANMVEKVEG